MSTIGIDRNSIQAIYTSIDETGIELRVGVNNNTHYCKVVKFKNKRPGEGNKIVDKIEEALVRMICRRKGSIRVAVLSEATLEIVDNRNFIISTGEITKDMNVENYVEIERFVVEEMLKETY